MGHTAAGETHETGMQVCKNLGEVRTHTILAPLEGLLREEGNHIDSHAHRLQRHNGQTRFRVGSGGGENGGILLPAGTACLQDAASQHLVAGAHQQDGKVLVLEEAADETLSTGLEEEEETNIEKSYFLPFSMTMPSQPSFHSVS